MFPLPPDQIAEGVAVYVDHCASCHGSDALGDSAPDIQGVILQDVKEALLGADAMPSFDLPPPSVEALTIYLMSLAPDQARARLKLK